MPPALRQLVTYVRALGVRRGIRWWMAYGRAARLGALPEFRVHHGVKPSMPGYRRPRT